MQQIVKLLNLTRSSNDSEALAAVRKVNGLVGDWGALLAPGGDSERPSSMFGRAKSQEEVLLAHLNVCLATARRKLWKDHEFNFLNQVHAKLLAGDKLSAKQLDWLLSLFRRIGLVD